MDREPGGKAQLAAALVAIASYIAAKHFALLPVELELLTPLLAYAAAQVAGWLWARTRTTPIASPRLAEGTDVRLPDGTPATVTKD